MVCYFRSKVCFQVFDNFRINKVLPDLFIFFYDREDMQDDSVDLADIFMSYYNYYLLNIVVQTPLMILVLTAIKKHKTGSRNVLHDRKVHCRGYRSSLQGSGSVLHDRRSVL
jgi:hypothetical protein